MSLQFVMYTNAANIINKHRSRQIHYSTVVVSLLTKWFWSIYFLGSDKGSISALRLSKLIEVNWRTARLILSKLRTAMGHRDSLYRLSGVIEIDDALVGGK
jgi:hypothetical protein